MSKKQPSQKQPAVNKPVNKQNTGIEDPGNSNFYKITWWILLGFIAFVFIKHFKKDPLLPEEETTELSFDTFSSGAYQEAYESELLKRLMFADFKKYKIEYEHSLFDKINLDDIFKGKDDYLFGEMMTRAYLGDDYHGAEAIKSQVQKAKFVQDKLKELGIEFLILYAPGKGSVYPEFLPETVLKIKKKTTNHETYVSESKKQQVNFIDFVAYFKKLKTKNKYPLFPRYGSHWSYYGECLAVDTTTKRLEKMLNVNLPSIVYDTIEMRDTTLARDADILRKAQMEIPRGHKLAYPKKVMYETGGNSVPVKILAIGDSYFRGFFYLGAMKYIFDNSQQWYYYNSIIPEKPDNPEVWELDLKEEILKTKAIVLICNESNLENLGNGFVDDAYELFKNPGKYYAAKKEKDKISKHKKEIRNDKAMLPKLIRESQQRGITLDSLIAEVAVDRNTKKQGKK